MAYDPLTLQAKIIEAQGPTGLSHYWLTREEYVVLLVALQTAQTKLQRAEARMWDAGIRDFE